MDSTFWAFISLILFVALLVYMKVPGMISGALDRRAETISNDLGEARRMRDEAQRLLADYQRRRKEAEEDAAEIVASAEREAKAIVAEAKQRTEDYVERRTAMAEEKIAKAEADAVREVRIAAVDLAVAAAERIIVDKADGATQSRLFDESLADVRQRLN